MSFLVGEKVRALLIKQATALGRGAAAGAAAAASRESVRDLLTEVVGMNHAATEGRSEMVWADVYTVGGRAYVYTSCSSSLSDCCCL